MSLERHVHCGECFREIATTIAVKGGKTKDVEVASGTQAAVVMGPDGPSVVRRPVPLCQECLDRINAQALMPPSKLIVPTMQAPPIVANHPMPTNQQVAVRGIDSAEQCQ